MKKYRVGILGATGMIGQSYLLLLKDHPWFEVEALAASKRSAGKKYEEAVASKWAVESELPEKFKDIEVLDAVNDIKKIASQVDFVFCAVDMEEEKVKQLEVDYAKLECPVVSNNSAHRFFKDIPLVVPEINSDHIKVIPLQKQRLGTKRGFIATKSNCSIMSYIPAAHPLMELGIQKILVCTYQALSGAGKTHATWPEMEDNVIPFISGEEEKSEKEPLKIWGNLGKDGISLAEGPSITAQCVRIPVNYGHTAAVFMSFKNEVSLEDIINRWESYEGYSQKLSLPSSPAQFLHYHKESDRPQLSFDVNCEKGMGISIGRLRRDTQYDIKFVCMSNNLVRGAAGGAVLLAELLCKEGYI